MKADERHRLKTNELAESLRELPEYLRNHGSQILTWVIVALIVLVSVIWFVRSRSRAARQRNHMLQQLATKVELAQISTAEQAPANPETGEPPTSLGYDAKGLTAELGSLAERCSGTATGMMALIQQAEAVRSELLFSGMSLADQEREAICAQAESLYQKLLSEYGGFPLANGSARIGLALVAEERRQWDQAREEYQEIVAMGTGVLAGTVFPGRAAARLTVLEDIREPVVFSAPQLVAPTSLEDFSTGEQTGEPVTTDPCEG